MQIKRVFRKRKEQQNFKRALSEFNRSLTLIADQEQLKSNILMKIKEISQVSSICIFLLNRENNVYQLTEARNAGENKKEMVFGQEDKLIFWLKVNETFLNVIENEEVHHFLSQREKEMVKALQAELICPLIVMNKLIGMVMLGQKTDKSRFSQEELELLMTLLDQASFAFENSMLHDQQKERIKKMYRADRLAIMGQLAAGAAHEIRNPLTSIRSTIQYIQKDIKDPDKSEMVKELINEVDRINDIIHGLLSFSRPDNLQTEKTSVKRLLDQVVTLTANTARKHCIEVNVEYNTVHIETLADPLQLKQVFLNVVLNAFQAMEKGGKLSILVDSREHRSPLTGKKQQELMIRFTDNGKGIPEAELEKIFDPFFTTKTDGTGLGLSISYGIVNQHGGDIEVQSKVGVGTTVLIKLPIHP